MLNRRHCLQAVVAVATVTPSLAAVAPPPADLAADLEAIRQSHSLPALAAAVVKGGAPIAVGATGVRVLGRSDKVTLADRFHIGSDTKAMTATLAGMLVDEGKLAWTTTIGESLGAEGLHPELAAVTLDQLLSHASGLPSDNEELLQIYFTADALQFNIAETRLAAFAKMKGKPPATKPGAAFHYSNFGYMIAGMVVERAAGVTWEELIHQRLFTPLGLASAGIGPQATTGLIDAAIGHDLEEGKPPKPMLWGPAADVPPLLGPAGACHMSVLDFAAWGGWNAGQGRRGPALVRPETLAHIHAPKISTGKLANPRPGTPSEGQYASGWGVLKLGWTANPILTHNGSNSFNLAKILVDPQADVAVAVMINFPGSEADAAASEALEMLYRRFV